LSTVVPNSTLLGYINGQLVVALPAGIVVNGKCFLYCHFNFSVNDLDSYIMLFGQWWMKGLKKFEFFGLLFAAA